jgi:hypothetical protein
MKNPQVQVEDGVMEPENADSQRECAPNGNWGVLALNIDDKLRIIWREEGEGTCQPQHGPGTSGP